VIDADSVNLRVAAGGGLSGDYNNNGKVDAADYVLWRKNPSLYGGTPGGYNTWRANFGKPPGSGLGSAASVPEPTGASLLMLAMLGLGGLPATRLGRRKFAENCY
jgi:hypothetical protein